MNDFYFAMLPGVDHEEMIWLEELTRKYDPATRQRFLLLYQGRRKDPQTVLITCLLGFVCVSGIHRFILDQILMGILYLFTAGFCFIGTIVDAINYRKLTWEHNKKVSMEIAGMMGQF